MSSFDLTPEEKKKALEAIRCFVLDMDGTIYLGNDLFPFTIPFLDRVKESGRKYYFFTNNSSKNTEAYREKLGNMGIRIRPEQMMIASHVAIRYLQKNYPGKTIYLVGTPSLVGEFEKSGLPLVQEDPDIVVLGFDTTLTYEKLYKACHYVRKGVLYFAINPDWNCPIEGGDFLPDCGSMARLVEASTGRWPEFFGKPSHHTLEYITEAAGCRPEEIAIVGDRLYTDIAVADQSPVKSILVLTGEGTLREAEEGNPVRPDYVFESLEEIRQYL